jgi:hypothetical protein
VTVESFWLQVDEGELRQGDYLPGCSISVVASAFAVVGEPHEIRTDQGELIIVTQSCDLEQRKVRLVAGYPIFPLAEFEAVNPAFARKGRWNEVLKGRIEGLHLLASPTAPVENRQALVFDFREIFSLPHDYLVDHAKRLGPRWRLKAPFLEHFSQAFARFFMRVGLPSTIPEFR